MANKEKPNVYVSKISPELGPKLLAGLQAQNFTITTPPYTQFSGKKSGVSCTLYESGKLVVQGKGMGEFIEFFLEPEILGDFAYSYGAVTRTGSPTHNAGAHSGIDESGKGDFFGPLCIAGVFATEAEVEELIKLGVRDSKTLNDKTILAMADKIEKSFTHSIVRINPPKYNELYEKFRNLNHMLAWGHATVIEELVKKSGCKVVIIDQFASEHVVETALKRKNLEVELTQRHRGEEDVVVAAASLLARKAFVQGLAKLSDQFGINLPKGASNQVIEAGREYVKKFGPEALNAVCKLHFQTTEKVKR